MIWFELVAGLVLLLVGGEGLIRGGVDVARRLGVSPLLIGLTLVGYGTSTPELVASVNAAMIGAPGIAIGNVVGSNIANILLILGVSAVIAPVLTTKEAFRRDGTVLIGASVLLVLVVLTGSVSRYAGLGFLGLLIAYTLYAYFSEKNRTPAVVENCAADVEVVSPSGLSFPAAMLMVIAGIAAVVFGASLLVQSSMEIARSIGMSETLIGLTLVAVGTSLPELATSVLAALRKQGDLAFGNIVGSNIYNIFGILGVTGALEPIPVPDEILRLDIWVMLATAIILVIFAVTDWRVSRREGLFFIAAYGIYLFVLLSPMARS